MAHPTKKGQKYNGLGHILTVAYFHGSNGIPFDTYEDCKNSGPKDAFICVVNKEFGGATKVEQTILIQ
jgi:hypothetical protein